MKYAAFTLALLAGVPLMAGLALWRPRYGAVLLGLLVFSTVMGDRANINFISLEAYRGPDRGFEVNLTDLTALAMALVLLVRHPRRVRWLPYNSLWMAGFFGVALLSTLMAPVPLLGWFSVVKLAKAYLIFWVVANALRAGITPRAIWAGCAVAGLYLAASAFHQKYVDGLYRVHGPFDHSNSIPLYTNLILPVLLFWSLADRELPRWASRAGTVIALGMAFAVVATMSRAGIALMGLMLAGALVVAHRRARSRRVTATAVLVGLAALAGGIVASDSLLDRVRNAPE
ncbi:MAG TPA: hypothetical protein VF862_02530, partial [Gemmatimonadales bacterium]